MLSVMEASAKTETVTAEVNLRKGPGTDTDVITLIPKGSTVEVTGCTNGWCQIKFNDQEGYAVAQNLGGPRPVRRRLAVPDRNNEMLYGRGPAYVGAPVYYYGPGPYYYGPGPYPYWGPRWGWARGWGWPRW